MVRRALHVGLTASGYIVEKAGTVDEASIFLRRSPIDLVLMDINMPGISGNKTCRRIHSTLLRAIWGPEYGRELEYLRTHIRTLRRKIEDSPLQPEYLVSEPWLGYRFRDPSSQITAFFLEFIAQRELHFARRRYLLKFTESQGRRES